MTAWEEPYIGEESITRPPPAKKALMTAVHSSRSSASSPTLKVIQLPSPTTGSLSPLEGIGLVSRGACASAEKGRSSAPAVLAAIAPSNARRLRTGSRYTERGIGFIDLLEGSLEPLVPGYIGLTYTVFG